MAVTNAYKASLLRADVNLDTGGDTLRVALLTDVHVTDVDTQVFWSDINANEISGTGYTAGGETLANQAVTQDNTDNEGVFDADDVTWVTATFTARFFVIYQDTGLATTSRIVRVTDFGSNQSVSAANFTIQWSAEGILNVN